MKLFSIKAELDSLYALTNGPSRVSNTLIARLNERTFHFPPAKEAIKRFFFLLRKRNLICTWDEILVDPIISEEARKHLKKYSPKRPIETRTRAIRVTEKLNEYAALRSLYGLGSHIHKSVGGENVNVEELITQAADTITNLRVKSVHEDAMMHMGMSKRGIKKNSKYIRKLLQGSKHRVIPTGFPVYDNINQGIPRGSCFVWGGPTGTGKSTLCNQLALNAARAGFKVCVVSLEMNAEEHVPRMLGNLCGIDVSDIQSGKLSPKNKERVIRIWEKFEHYQLKYGGKYTLFTPEEDVTIEETLYTLKPYKFDMIIIDYVSLLKGMDDDQMWRRLGEVVRFSKRFAAARSNDNVICILVQTTDDGLVRYSRTMTEHASNCWIWKKYNNTNTGGESNGKGKKNNNEQHEQKQIRPGVDAVPIEQLKSRTSKDFSFTLFFMRNVMQVSDRPESLGKPGIVDWHRLWGEKKHKSTPKLKIKQRPVNAKLAKIARKASRKFGLSQEIPQKNTVNNKKSKPQPAPPGKVARRFHKLDRRAA